MNDRKVIDLAAIRSLKSQTTPTTPEQAEMFKFEPFEFIDDDSASNGVMLLANSHACIGILLDAKNFTGIRMTPDTARRLAKELEGLVNEYEEPVHED